MFSEQLRNLRREKNLTQIELADLLNISHGAIALWETNKRKPDIETLEKIADYFEVSTDYLLGRKFKKNELVLKDEELQILNTARQLNQINLIKFISFGLGLLANQE